ncbi:MAG: lysostaphin resistance A-like protein [Planctomycetaceae bacterium]
MNDADEPIYGGSIPSGADSVNPYRSEPTVVEVDATIDGAVAAGEPRLWTVSLTFFVAFIGMLVASVLAVLPFVIPEVMANGGQAPAPDKLAEKLTSPVGFLATAFPPQLCLMLTAVMAAYLSPIPLKQRLGLKPSGLTTFETAVVAMSVFLPGTIGMLLANFLSSLMEPDPTAAKLWDNMTPAFVVPYVMFIALMPGFGEEMLFRGYLQRRLLKRWSPMPAILLTSLLFAAIHLMPHTVVFAFPVGLWLGYIAWKTDSIWPTILAHVTINGVWNIVQTSKSLMGYSDTVYYVALAVIVVLGVAAFVRSLGILSKRTTEHPQPT